jgi:hypothetical protein
MCALAHTAAITIIDEVFFKNGRDVVEYEMMDNPVAEIRCENFPLYGLVHYKTNAWLWFIFTRNYFFMQGKEIGFKVFFKDKGINGIAFIFPRVKIGLK